MIPKKKTPSRLSASYSSSGWPSPSNFPPSYQESASHTPLPRVICDYIAGMTDNYIYEQYEKYRL